MFRSAILLAVALSIATPTFAQSAATRPDDVNAFRASVAAVRFDPSGVAYDSAPATNRVPRREMSTGKRVLWTSLAGLGGFFAGGYIGAAIDGDCGGCDDPGFKGFLIGLPIGTAAAAITTWILTGK
ncbi:MAG TPA: hypothetical protein VFV98_15665 [Vicinamibacterales bacterium]|nr:hypothetical protein [Vicinamibacterales bacterium]